jgi:hypothetical protein
VNFGLVTGYGRLRNGNQKKFAVSCVTYALNCALAPTAFHYEEGFLNTKPVGRQV